MIMCHFLHYNYIFYDTSDWFKTRELTKIETKRTHRIHPACTPSSPTERDLSSLSLEKGGHRETDEEREGNRWRDTETKQNVHVCVWSHVPKCVFIECQKKVGQWIWHHLLRGEDGGKKDWRRCPEEVKEQRNGNMKEEGTSQEKKKKLKRGDKTSRRDKRKGGKRKGTGCLPVRTDVISPASCIRLPSDQRLPLTLTFGPLKHRFHLELSALTLLVLHFILAQRPGLIHFQ